jgi:hypothetical protein
VSKLHTISKGSTGGENRIPKAQRAETHAEVDVDRGAAARGSVCSSHFTQRIARLESMLV